MAAISLAESDPAGIGATGADVRARVRTTFIGVAVMAGTMAFIAWEFRGVVAPPLLSAWVGYMLAVDASLLASLVLTALPPSPWRWPVARWARVSRIFSVAFSLGVVVGVWILLPPAGPALRMLAFLLFVWFVAMMMMSSGALINMVGCLALLASLAAFVATSDMAFRWQLLLFLAGVGAALVGIRRAIWRAADEAAAARVLSEEAAATLSAALALMQAQRDAKTRFIAAASHDLQQPVQAARLFVDQLATAAAGPARDRAQAGAARALDASQALIASMLDFLRLEAGAVTARVRPVALAPLLADVAATLGERARAQQVRIAVGGGTGWALADPVLLTRALGNLAANALDHADGTRLLLIARRRGACVRLWALDDGRGVTPADRARLFDDYAQGAGTDPAAGGFGLGLASVRRLAAVMGGSAGLDARWTGGAAFYLDLPAAVAPAVMEEEPACAAA